MNTSILASLFRLHHTARPTLLLGAGASFHSGVPLADKAIFQIAKAELTRSKGPGIAVRPTDVNSFLRRQDWFIRDPSRYTENFQLVVQKLLVPREHRRSTLAEIIAPAGVLSPGYEALARLATRGVVRTLLTTNFDNCIARALDDQRPHLRGYCEVGRGRGDVTQFSVFPDRPQIVYLHGSVEHYSDLNTESETQQLDTALTSRLEAILLDAPLVVVGYRGAEASVMDNFLNMLARTPNAFRHGIYWCRLANQTLHPRVVQLAGLLGSNFIELEIPGFDELLVDLDESLADEDAYRTASLKPPVAPDLPDETIVANSTIDDISLDDALVTLTAYCSELRRPIPSKDSLLPLLTELKLVGTDQNGNVAPTLAGVLLFGTNPQRFVPHAIIEVAVGGRRKRVLQGSLVAQFQELLELAQSNELNPLVTLKRAGDHELRSAYPLRALTEMSLNLLVHRDYTKREPSRVDLMEGEAIEFVSPGGLLERFSRKVKVGTDGQFKPVRGLSAIRNPGLADVFAGTCKMEKSGSGLPDTEELMAVSGGSTKFIVDGENAHFKAVLIQPRARSRGIGATALPVGPLGTFITNQMRLLAVPESISVVETPSVLRHSLEQTAALLAPESRKTVASPISVRQRERVLSFAEPDALNTSSASARTLAIEAFLRSPGGRAGFVQLVNRHFVEHLKQHQRDGLFVERDGHRAYFTLMEASKTTIRYDANKRTGVKRDVVKRRETSKATWHENEGFAFAVVEFDGHWAIQIKPFYMFTGEDGITPLDGLRRTSLSTRRIKFDRNPNVASDLQFWAKYISSSKPIVQLSTWPTYNLALSGKFESFDAVEEIARKA